MMVLASSDAAMIGIVAGIVWFVLFVSLLVVAFGGKR